MTHINIAFGFPGVSMTIFPTDRCQDKVPARIAEPYFPEIGTIKDPEEAAKKRAVVHNLPDLWTKIRLSWTKQDVISREMAKLRSKPPQEDEIMAEMERLCKTKELVEATREKGDELATGQSLESRRRNALESIYQQPGYEFVDLPKDMLEQYDSTFVVLGSSGPRRKTDDVGWREYWFNDLQHILTEKTVRVRSTSARHGNAEVIRTGVRGRHEFAGICFLQRREGNLLIIAMPTFVIKEMMSEKLATTAYLAQRIKAANAHTQAYFSTPDEEPTPETANSSVERAEEDSDD